VIVRIATEGQYEVPEADAALLRELDEAAIAASEGGDEADFDARFAELIAFIRSTGQPVDDDHLGGSDLIVPPPDVTFAEASAEFSGEGLLPNT
jgi:hypothetical protein